MRYLVIAAPLVIGIDQLMTKSPEVASMEVVTVRTLNGGPEAMMVMASENGPKPHLFLALILN